MGVDLSACDAGLWARGGVGGRRCLDPRQLPPFEDSRADERPAEGEREERLVGSFTLPGTRYWELQDEDL